MASAQKTPAARAAKGVPTLKLDPAIGRMPALQYLLVSELDVDAAYQRSVEAASSQALIRQIAQRWNWDLCQPLSVSQRDGKLYVIDGQHRLSAARLRGDIQNLPCVVKEYGTAAEEAASFVQLNQARRALSAADMFRAGLASGDAECQAIAAALDDAELVLAPHNNYDSWKAGYVGNIAGIRSSWKTHGPEATREALQVLSTAYAGQVLRYAGTLFPSIAAICAAGAEERGQGQGLAPALFARFTAWLDGQGQEPLYRAIIASNAEFPTLGKAVRARLALERHWRPDGWAKGFLATQRGTSSPAIPPADAAAPTHRLRQHKFNADGQGWCSQCEAKVSKGTAIRCKSVFCTMKEPV